MEKISKYTMIIFAIITAAFVLYAYFNPISRKLHFTSSSELMHFGGFSILSFFIAGSFSGVRIRLILLLCSVGYLLEIAQPLLTAQREFSYSDVWANFIGIFVGVFIFTALRIFFSYSNAKIGKT